MRIRYSNCVAYDSFTISGYGHHVFECLGRQPSFEDIRPEMRQILRNEYGTTTDSDQE